MHGLPVRFRNVAVVQMKLEGQLTHGFPLSGFLRQHESIEGAETAGPSQQHGLAFLIDGDIVEHLAHGNLKNVVHQGKHAHQEQVGISVLNFGRE